MNKLALWLLLALAAPGLAQVVHADEKTGPGPETKQFASDKMGNRDGPSDPNLPRKAIAGWESQSSATPVKDAIATAKILDKSGKPIKRESGKLSAGDYDIKLGDGRHFALHVPNNATGATMYVFQGSMEPKWKQDDFARQTQMDREADKSGFIVVYIHPQMHFLAQYSKEQAWAYNAPNSMIEERNTAQAGYNDNKYLDIVRKIMPKIAKVEPSTEKTAAISFSQGGAFLRQYLTGHANFAQTLGFVGTAFPKGDLAALAAGNGGYIMEVNLLADKNILPKQGQESLEYLQQKAAHAAVDATGIGRANIEQADPLSPIRNDLIQDSGPVLKRGLSAGYAMETTKFGGGADDTITSMRDKNSRRYDEINLPHAGHAYPSDNPFHVQTSSSVSYNAPISFWFAQQFASRIKTARAE